MHRLGSKLAEPCMSPAPDLRKGGDGKDGSGCKGEIAAGCANDQEQKRLQQARPRDLQQVQQALPADTSNSDKKLA